MELTGFSVVLPQLPWAGISLLCLQATDFLFQVFAAAVVSWGDHYMPVLLGIRTQWFPWQTDSRPTSLQHSLYGEEHAFKQCLLAVSHSLPLLLDKEPWSSQKHKVTATLSFDFYTLNTDYGFVESNIQNKIMFWLRLYHLKRDSSWP